MATVESVLDVLNLEPPDWGNPADGRAAARASIFNEEGGTSLDAGDIDTARRLFEQAIELDELDNSSWFNLGLVYKRRRDWLRAAACNRRALAVESEEQDPAYWNLGIAATALRDWETARWAWEGYGIAIPEGDGPIEADFGPSPVRLDPDGVGEVVWGRRIDPARIVVLNVPLPGSGRRWREIVLHDGEPRGEREWNGHNYPVFDELDLWQASGIPTWECLVTFEDGIAIEALIDRFDGAELGVEDWTRSLRWICSSCSQGTVADEHRHGAFSAVGEGNHIGIAAPREVAEQLLDAWVEDAPGRTRTDLVAAGS